MNALRSCSVLNTSETQHLPVFDSSPDYERADLARGLNWRHMQVIAIGAIAIIGTLIPFTDPNLLRSSESDIAYSPFTLVFDRLGVAAAAAVMNAVILTPILSAGNSGLYASSRMLQSMALIGQAPRVFCHVTKRGVPLNAMLATAVVSALGFCTALVGEGTAYTWLVSIVGVSGIFMWLGIAACHIRFRRAYLLQGTGSRTCRIVPPSSPSDRF